MNSRGYWCTFKSKYLSRLAADTAKGIVDSDITDLLNMLNAIPCIVTTSSCSGRIAVFAAPTPGDKRRGGIVVSWHRHITPTEIKEAINLAAKQHRFVWVSAQPLIIALYAYMEKAALEIVKLAERVGLKYSFYKRRRSGFYYTLILGTERIDVPVSYNGRLLARMEELDSMVAMLNTYLALTKSKLEKFKRLIASTHQFLAETCPEDSYCDEATLYGAQSCEDRRPI